MYKTKVYGQSGGVDVVSRSKNAREALDAHRSALQRDEVVDYEQVITINAKGIIVGYGNDMNKLYKAGNIPWWM